MDYEPNGVLNTQADPGAAMPFSLEAEQSVLGAILLEPSCLSTVVDILPRPEYFYAVNNRLIYGAMVEMFALGQPVDFVTVLERLKEEKDFDEATGKVYLTQLAQLVPAISHVESYAVIVRDKYELRTLIRAARSILEDASAGEGETSLLLDSAEQRIYDIRRGKSDLGLQPLREVLLETFDRLDKLNSEDKDKYKGLPTGIKELDNTITGLNRSDLIVLAARPGVGKNQPGPEYRPACGGDRQKAGGLFLSGNGPGAAGLPPAVHRGPGGRHQAAFRRFEQHRVDPADRGGGHSPPGGYLH